MLIVDAIVAAILLGTAMAMLVPSLSAVRHQRQLLRFESLAMLELNNVAEFLPASPETAGPPALSDWFRSRYATAELKTELLPASEDQTAIGLQAIRLTIRRPGVQAMPDQSVSVVVWKTLPEAAP